MHRDLYNNTINPIGLNTQTFAADADNTGNIIDTQGYESGLVILILGTVTTGDIIITKVQESADSGMSGATDIPAARILGTAVALDTANTTNQTGFVSTLRYIQVTYTTANTAADLVAGSTIILGNPHNATTR